MTLGEEHTTHPKEHQHSHPMGEVEEKVHEQYRQHSNGKGSFAWNPISQIFLWVGVSKIKFHKQLQSLTCVDNNKSTVDCRGFPPLSIPFAPFVVHHLPKAINDHFCEHIALLMVIGEGCQVEDDAEESVLILDKSQIPLMR